MAQEQVCFGNADGWESVYVFQQVDKIEAPVLIVHGSDDEVARLQPSTKQLFYNCCLKIK